MSASKFTLLCNSHNCRTKLSGFAWVTACSHVFCDQHGTEEFSRTPAICPACSSMLSGKLDVLRTELAPSEQYKAMVLVGLQPETVLEISHKALDFWTYQVNQERLLMEYSLSRAGGQVLQMEKFMIQQNQSKELELNALRGEMASLKKVLEEYKRKYSEVLERLNERNGQYQKLQGLLDSLRMHTLGTGEKDPISHPFTTGLVKPRSSHNSPSFLGPEGDRFFSLGSENAKTFFQFSTPTRDRTQTFIKKN
ncbi:E3 ubiquitin-protein ligase CCNB1IP1 isoform X2 [Sinocyclocheilus anshuiensis]|uniref:E3 ubiquitin-protein ligase CCNB1IP1-like n=2 Tax=Sinocyclocheilus anshuiensis TaxID=1608454 RepID=A0A671LIF4_9TELE|nr:PREDICTED: E3 ubiquitin-protein ligase CCNB1IP1-like isoform X2 [Sinocyclocheilus anshuiensis]XP_016330269.1 PREDICTED: E3 ubiquitin-protein ligase CCNB1IP1-like isoform X2 [Sinocyclocheilus anshuiensis]